MSTLQVTNIQATGETASRAVSGVAASSVSVETNSTLGSFNLNISSVSDGGTGVLSVNMLVAFGGNIYNYGIGSSINGSGAGSTVRGANSSTTASLYSIRSYDSSNNAVDLSWQAHVFHGDLS